MTLDDFLRRVDEVLQAGQGVMETEHELRGVAGRWVSDQTFAAFRSSSLSLLRNLFGELHPYYREFQEKASRASPSSVRQGLGVLTAVREELAGGWIQTTKGLVSAELFADFIEMATHLLDEGYKDAAAVILGSTLEEHLRHLCQNRQIPTETTIKQGETKPKKADAMNSELASAKAYNVLDQKGVTAWLDLRNKAAHGRYNEYGKEQVQLMRQGIVDFMVHNPT